MKKGWLLLVWACAMAAFAADDPQELQTKIDAARARLDAAAHELAQLHQQLGNEETFEVAIPGPHARVQPRSRTSRPRSKLGVSADTARASS